MKCKTYKFVIFVGRRWEWRRGVNDRPFGRYFDTMMLLLLLLTMMMLIMVAGISRFFQPSAAYDIILRKCKVCSARKRVP